MPLINNKLVRALQLVAVSTGTCAVSPTVQYPRQLACYGAGAVTSSHSLLMPVEKEAQFAIAHQCNEESQTCACRIDSVVILSLKAYIV